MLLIDNVWLINTLLQKLACPHESRLLHNVVLLWTIKSLYIVTVLDIPVDPKIITLLQKVALLLANKFWLK